MPRPSELMFEPRSTARPSGAGIRQRGRPVTTLDMQRLSFAEIALRDTRNMLRDAGAHHAAARVRAALKSTQGALNHARAKLARQERRK